MYPLEEFAVGLSIAEKIIVYMPTQRKHPSDSKANFKRAFSDRPRRRQDFKKRQMP